MKDLVFAKGLSLPLDAVTQKFAFLGRSSSGKTYAAKRLVESLLDAGSQVVILDPVGIWHGLRVGDRKSYPIPVLGGLHGDLPLTGSSGQVVARIVCERRTSAVLDVSQMHDAERTRFATGFAQEFFALKKAAPSAVHLVIEEAQELLPQNPQPGEQLMLHEFQRIAKIGRNFGIGLSLVSQRPQEISKKALNQAECVLAFQMTGPQERKTLEYWLSDRGLEEKQLSKLLPTLAVGHPFIWSPSWLKVNQVIEILPIATSDTGKTPEPGAFASTTVLQSIDVGALRAELAIAVEQATADDPKLLKKRVAELEQLVAAEAPVAAFDGKGFLQHTQAIQRLLQAMMGKLKDVIDHQKDALDTMQMLTQSTDRLVAWGEEQTPLSHAARQVIDSMADALQVPRPSAAATRKGFLVTKQTVLPPAKEQTPPRPVAKRDIAAPPRDKVGALAMGESSVLQVLVAAGAQGCTKAQILLQTGYKKNSVRLYIGRLITAKLAQQADGIVRATPAGTKLCPDVKPLPKGYKLVQHHIDTLPSGESRVLTCVFGGGASVSKEQILEKTGFASNSVRLYIGRLVTRGLVVNAKGHVSMHPELGL